MSKALTDYLNSLPKVRVSAKSLSRTISAVCAVDVNHADQRSTLYYPRHTRLGAILLANENRERIAVLDMLRRDGHSPRAYSVSFVAF